VVGTLIALFPLLACGEAPQADAGVRTGTVSIFDSAGIVVSTYEQSLWDGTLHDLVPSEVIGEASDSPGPPLFAVTGAVVLDDGALVVANAGSHQILWFAPGGEFVRAVGSEGEGPGEFGGIRGITLCDSQRRLAVRGRSRITVLELDGRLVSARPIIPRPRERGLWVFDPMGDCGRILVGSTTHLPPPTMGLSRALEMSLAWVDQNDTRSELMPAFRWAVQFGGRLQGQPVALLQPWGPTAVWTTAGNRLLFGTGSTPALYWRELDGTVSAVVRWQEQARPIGPRDRESYSEARKEYLRDKPAHIGEIIASLEVASLPEALPLYDKLLVDAGGSVWVRRYPREASGRSDIPEWGGYGGAEEWAVLSMDDQPPARVRLPDRHRLLSVSAKWLVTVSFDSLDRESVNLFDREEVALAH